MIGEAVVLGLVVLLLLSILVTLARNELRRRKIRNADRTPSDDGDEGSP